MAAKDKELWEANECIFPENGDRDSQQSALVQIDCIVHSSLFSGEWNLLNYLYFQTFKKNGERRAKPVHNPKVLLTLTHDANHNNEHQFCIGNKLENPLESYRLRVRGGGLAPEVVNSFTKRLTDMCADLTSKFGGFGWFTGVPQFKVINFESDSTKLNQLCPVGDEHKHVLPVDSQQVLEWIQDGSVESGKVALLAFDVYGEHFLPQLETEYYNFHNELYKTLKHPEQVEFNQSTLFAKNHEVVLQLI